VYRAVLDPGVLIAALLSPSGAPAQVLRRWTDGELDLIVSPKLLHELRTVLARPKFRAYVTVHEANAYLNLLEQAATTLPDPQTIARLSPDPEDDYLLALAKTAAAQYLVSGDIHLLGLREFEPPVLTPRGFLTLLEKHRGRKV